MVNIHWHRTTACAVILFFLAHAGISQRALSSPNSAAPADDLTSMDLQHLLDLKVTTASLFTDKLSQAPGIMSVVTRDELSRFGAVTLGEVLYRVPGLTQSSQYFTDRSLVSADGDQTKTSGAHILFLINGRPTREVTEGGIISDLLESFPVEALERIEIIRGPGSVLYGSNAFSAVINLITRKADRTEMSIHGLGGVNGTLSASGHMFVKKGNFTMLAASQVRMVPDWNLLYNVPLPLQNLPTAPHEPPVQAATLVDRGTGDYLGVNYKGLSFMSAFTEWQSTGFTQGSVGETRLSRDFANLGYDRKVAGGWDMSFNATYTRTTFHIGAYPSTARDSNEFVAEWTNMVNVSSKDRLTTGMLFSRIAGTELNVALHPPVVDAGLIRPAGGFYAQLDHQLLPSMKLIGGFQSNKFANIPFSTVPRFGAIWSPSSKASVKVLYGVAFRPPSIDETTLNLANIKGNSSLLPETVGTFDLGMNLQFPRVELGADYFHSHQKNSIVSIGNAPIHYVNLDGVVFDGVDVEAKYYFRRNFFTQGSLLYQANHDQNGNSDVTPIPNLGFKIGSSYDAGRGLVFGLFDVSDGNPKPYAFNVNPLTGWRHSMNAELRKNVSGILPLAEGNNLTISVHANDLFDQSVWMPGFGFSNISSVPVQKGRAIYAGLELSYGKR